jgi:5-methylcytosine-specific restriction enzyme subunit McrC
VTIPIANLYRLFAYACGLMPRMGFVDVGREEPSDTLDLLARIVAEEARAITRRGLARDYVDLEEDLTAPRGRIDMQLTVARQTTRRGRLACAFDELSVDRPFNQILKATV